ncbi:signal peptidase I [Brachybacterium phenoliresistens]|uniref:Signal peptidase I n=1 Tax=Brachybacterium phenoliresistens TaxID=396014 RepID=Z9JS29_9MICO|nr:signal peptidase I [Brachybacterium phenoliresistens]EWS81180.1 signal peptidase I [Brachybacterium phenoliresistens]
MVAAAVLVVLLLVAAFTIRHLVVEPFEVPSASMEPTLRAGDVILVDRQSRRSAERGQVVVFDGRGYFGGQDGTGHYWVKRVIAVGGDRVTCCDDAGAILVDGEPIAEPYLAPGTAPSLVAFDLEVPEGRMFLLGDNRADSTDSRSLLGAPGGGMVPVDRVVGEARRIVWPPPRSGAL